MHPGILLDLLRNGNLTKDQLTVEQKDAVQVLMIERYLAELKKKVA